MSVEKSPATYSQGPNFTFILGNIPPTIPHRSIRTGDQFTMKAFKKGFQACCFDGVKRHTVNPRCPVIPLGHLVGFPKRFHLADVNVQSPKPPGLVGLRLQVNLPPQVLQTDGRLCHLTLASRVVGRSLALGLLRSPVITRFIATANPSATLSSSANFPGSPVIWPTLLRQFLGGTRRVSPVARHVLATVLSLSPRRSEMPLQPACGTSCCLRPMIGGSASGAMHFRGHLCVHFRYGPVTRSPSHGWLCRWASSTRFPSYLPSKLQGLWLLPWRD